MAGGPRPVPLDPILLGQPGVGPKMAERLSQAGLTHLGDLVTFAPRRYDDAGSLRPIASLTAGERAFVEGKVVRANVRRFFRRATLEVYIDDDAGDSLLLRWFRFRGEVPARFAVGARVRAAGLVRNDKRGREMIQPVCDEVSGADRSLRPRYAPIDGVPAALVAKLAAIATVHELPDAPSWLPSLAETLRALHVLDVPEGAARDAIVEGRSPAHERLAFEELLVLRLAANEVGPRATPLPRVSWTPPFPPTKAQARAIAEISDALAKPTAMRRLLTGDVGSGKTLVAAAAIEQCLAAGQRAAFLAPTAILAEQQFGALARMLPTRRVALLHAGTSKKERAELATLLQSAEPLVVVGTHALLEEDARIERLGLLVIDEQQRFGVRQRGALVDVQSPPHQLALSATPIPRTLALALRGLLEVSHLDEKPAGRSPIATAIVSRTKALSTARDHRSAYWIAPVIDDDGATRGVLSVYAWLEKALDVPIHLVHGKMPVNERTAQLEAFRQDGGVLVGTTVVEVGLDVPDATLMVIESPERLGLSQLHQLRGRVGRGDEPGRCLLVAEQPTKRLSLVADMHDGLAIAEADLMMRGMGELGGEQQSGFPSLPPLDKARLEVLVQAADEAAAKIAARDPELREPGHARLARQLRRRKSYDSA